MNAKGENEDDTRQRQTETNQGAVAFALALHAMIGLPAEALVLAFAPGGLTEMTLIALSLDIDPAFVSTHHVVRIFLVVVLAPLAFKVLAPRLGVGGDKIQP